MGDRSLRFCSDSRFANIFACGSALFARGHDLKASGFFFGFVPPFLQHGSDPFYSGYEQRNEPGLIAHGAKRRNAARV